jgi:hypothetical protein
MDAGLRGRNWVEKLEKGDERALGKARPQKMPRKADSVRRHQEGASAGGFGERKIFWMGQKRDLIGSRCLQRRHPSDDAPRITFENRSKGPGKLTQRVRTCWRHPDYFFLLADS